MNVVAHGDAEDHVLYKREIFPGIMLLDISIPIYLLQNNIESTCRSGNEINNG